jgi:predicted PurR-regulated permease PerM
LALAALKTLRQLLSGEDLIQPVIRFGLLALLIVWTFNLVRPFVTIVVWALVLAATLKSSIRKGRES